MEESNLISGIKNGSNAAIGKFYGTYEHLFYAVAKQYLQPYGTEEDLEDCVQYTFARVWEDIDQFDSRKSSFKNWCLMLLKRRVLNEHKRLMREHQRVKKSAVTPQYVDAVQAVIDRDIILTVAAIISRWNYPKSEIAKMRYLEEEKPKYIAKALGLPIQKVNYYLYESKKALQKELRLRGFVEK